MKRLLNKLAIAVMLTCVATTALSQQQDYPNRPIKLIVPSAPGGPVDAAARAITTKMGEILGQPVVIHNQVGAGGNIGTAEAVRSKPDGYTLLYSGAGPIAISPLLVSDLGYDPRKELVPLVLTATTPALIVTGPNSPVSSLRDLVEKAKSQPGKFTYSTAGLGGPSHLAFESLKMQAGIDLLGVPYKGVPQATTAVMADEVTVGIATFNAMEFVKAGRMKALAVTSQQRESSMPGVPTVSEEGVSNLLYVAWFGLFAPTGTPSAIQEKLVAAAMQAASDDAAQTVLKAQFGVGTKPQGPEDFAKRLNEDHQRLQDLIRAQKIKIN